MTEMVVIERVKYLENRLRESFKIRDIKQIRILDLEDRTEGECFMFTFDSSGGFSEKECTGFGINISVKLLEKSDQRIDRVIIHELIHTIKGNYNHQQKFHKTLDKAIKLIYGESKSYNSLR
jgi:hypothetical protein